MCGKYVALAGELLGRTANEVPVLGATTQLPADLVPSVEVSVPPLGLENIPVLH